jgi:predicted peptidase
MAGFLPLRSRRWPSKASAGRFAARAGVAIAVLLGAACAHQGVFVERSLKLGEARFRYRVYVPQHYTKLHRWPVILFLHGSGERGEDNTRQIGVGLGPALREFPDRYHCVVVFPQCRFGEEWYGDMEVQAMAALQEAIREFRGDRARVYVTGVSMGGTGAWTMARHRNLFAAVVPVCGEIVRQPDDPFPLDPPPDIRRLLSGPDPYEAVASAVAPTPVWVFHGADDRVVPATESRRMVAALQRLHKKPHYTEYPEVGHDAWDHAYAEPDLVHWLFEQRLH